MDGTVEIEHVPGVDVLVLQGEHDLSTQAAIRTRVDEALTSGKSVVIDLSAAEFIDSSVLAAILHGQRRATSEDGGRSQELAVVASPGAKFVARLLSLVQIENHVNVHLSRDSAIVSLQRDEPPADGHVDERIR
jgi:anti-sigma B factor antagonist